MGCGVSCPWANWKIPTDLWEKCCGYYREFLFNWIFFILAGNKHMHKSLNEFEFPPDPTGDLGVIYPWAPGKSTYYLVATLAPSFLIGSSSFLLVTRTTNKSGQSLNFYRIRPRAAELQPLIDVGNQFLLNILRMDGQNLTKFCIHIIIDKIYVGIVKGHFSLICNWVRPLIDVRNWFLLNILRMDGQNLTKFCIHIIIDKVYFGIVNCHFSQICNWVTALDWCQKMVFAQYLIINGQNLTKLCIYITIDIIYLPSVLQTELCSWTYLCPLIVLWWGYGQFFWQF